MTKYFTPTTVAIGNFDGIHCGHQQVLQPILNSAGHQIPKNGCQNQFFSFSTECNETQIYYPTVVTFNPHPKQFFSRQHRPLLTPLQEKIKQLLSLGIKQVVPLTFNEELATISPQQFVEKILVQQLKAQKISVGHDFRFGYQRKGTATDLQEIAGSFGIPVTIVPPYTYKGERISSSLIRQSLEQGNLQYIKALLGRSYTLQGFTEKQQEMGDFSRIKLKLPSEKLLPRPGSYAARVFIEDANQTALETAILKNLSCQFSFPLLYQGIVNINNFFGINEEESYVEIYLLDWPGDLQGQTITIELEYFLRPQLEFTSLEALKKQIQIDLSLAKVMLDVKPTSFVKQQKEHLLSKSVP
ncbi:riboflavin biosynthesis protein RibF [Gloeothece verrucosa]|uniref:Riboflavin biosynthesis protein n=1 Tax=Gloeothece verrucosa (strain PCC 7822) TaxID=497965 RepID=E0ULP4_GLOV7|nr:riboflavin biosynthesis protein RibF [Gloeothece verrucosa]ADN17874.1 riboflavin biosynthesis protein RibF [Gloeothece verrucosa PCC 7822]